MRYILLILTIKLFTSCSKPTLNGHYHLIWDEGSEQFQSWNIINNKMIINEYRNDDYFSMIIFKNNKIIIDPWVDSVCEYYYKKEKDGSISIFDEHHKMRLIPHTNCINITNYFNNKVINYVDSFNLVNDLHCISSKAFFPNKYQNELIVGINKNLPIYIFNNNIIYDLEYIPDSQNEDIWLSIDKQISLKDIAPILFNLYKKNYNIYLTAQMCIHENNEQIIIYKRNIKGIKLVSDNYEINYCNSCSKYPEVNANSIVNISMINSNLYTFNGDTNDLFQTRNSLVRYIGQNRTTRLNTQINISINGNTKYEDYFSLLEDLEFVETELKQIVFYNGLNDVDMEKIKNNQLERNYNEVINEFPIRIKEIITKD